MFAVFKLVMDKPFKKRLWFRPLSHFTKLAIIFFGTIWVISCVYIFAPFASVRNLEFESFLWTLSAYAVLFAIIDIVEILYRTS